MPKNKRHKLGMQAGTSKQAKHQLSRTADFKPKQTSEHRKADPIEFVFRSFVSSGYSKEVAVAFVFLIFFAQGIDAFNRMSAQEDIQNPDQQKGLPGTAQKNSLLRVEKEAQCYEESFQGGASCTTHTSKPVIFSSWVRSGVHPGLHCMKTGHKTNEEAQLKFVQLIKDQELQENYLEELQKVNGILEIDQPHIEGEASARFHHDKALDWLETVVLKQPIKDLLAEQFNSLIQKTNGLLLSPDEKDKYYSATEGLSNFRTRDMYLNKVPGFSLSVSNGDQSIAYLQKNDPKSIPAFMRFADIQNQLVNERIANPSSFDANRIFDIMLERDPSLAPLFRKYVTFMPSSAEVPALMRQFHSKLQEKLQAGQDPIHIAAFAHIELVRIHPFNEGNGRTARALMNTLLEQFGLPSVAFFKNIEYMKVVTSSVERNNPSIFENYLKTIVVNMRDAKRKKIAESIPERMAACIQKCSESCIQTCESLLKTLVQSFEGEKTKKPKSQQAHSKSDPKSLEEEDADEDKRSLKRAKIRRKKS